MISQRKGTVLAGIFLAGSLVAGQGRAGEIKGKVSVQGIKSAARIAVYVDAIPGKKFDPPSEHAAINQQGMAFSPRVAVVLQGTTVDFSNNDEVAHNVYWPSISGNKKLAGNLGSWPQDEKRSFQFNDVGVAALLCNAHPDMSGYLIVVPTPYFAVTDKEGNYDIKNVPPGQYVLKTWSEDGSPATQSVEVKEDAALVADLLVKK
jgi:plastocyanin